jgi:hypothetical protein
MFHSCSTGNHGNISIMRDSRSKSSKWRWKHWLARVSTLIIYLSFQYCFMDFLDGSFNVIVNISSSYQSVYYQIHMMNWFSWWNCTRGGVGLSMLKALITHNTNSLVRRYICTNKRGRGETDTHLVLFIISIVTDYKGERIYVMIY